MIYILEIPGKENKFMDVSTAAQLTTIAHRIGQVVATEFYAGSKVVPNHVSMTVDFSSSRKYAEFKADMSKRGYTVNCVAPSNLEEAIANG